MLKNRRQTRKTTLAWLRLSAGGILVTVILAAITVAVIPLQSKSDGNSRITSPITTNSTSVLAANSTTSTTSTTSTSSSTTSTTLPPGAPGLISAGASRRECVDPNFNDTGLAAINAAVSQFDSVTHTKVTCLSAYLNGEPGWFQWEHPWIISPQFGYTSWVAKEPTRRQLVLQVDLIPASLKNVQDPLSWEESCAAGDFNGYATSLGVNLVAVGLQNSVIRLGAEMNGIWEEDYVGPTAVEQRLWAECFANEVTHLRDAPGENFLIDWDPNACVEDIPFANYYPGNAYVDIMGLDIYDVSCISPYSRQTFKQLSEVPLGITSFENFAAVTGKPMSFPEWGLKKIPNGDDPGYIDGMGAIFTRGNVAFETYFNVDVKIRPYLALGPQAPLALAAFRKWFGTG